MRKLFILFLAIIIFLFFGTSAFAQIPEYLDISISGPARAGFRTRIEVTTGHPSAPSYWSVRILDFGDGSSSSTQICATFPPNIRCSVGFDHTYTHPGDYTIVAQSCGGRPSDCKTATYTLHVEPPSPVSPVSPSHPPSLIRATGYNNPLLWRNIVQFLLYALRFIFNLILGVSILMVVVSGIILATSRGDPIKQRKGKRTLIFATIGLLIALLAQGLFALFRLIFRVRI